MKTCNRMKAGKGKVFFKIGDLSTCVRRNTVIAKEMMAEQEERTDETRC